MRVAVLLLIFIATPIEAQDRYPDDREDQSLPINRPVPQIYQGETARSTAGQAGLRQTRERVAEDAGIKPMARINGRLQSRVQSRIRNRIDRYYDPQANATSPFKVASDQARVTGRPSR